MSGFNGSPVPGGVWVTGIPPYFSGVFTSTAVHTNGSNYLAADGHVKWLQPTAISGGTYFLASSPNYVQTDNRTSCGTAAMKDAIGDQYVLTFSPV
jgi:prepilin-type processing-associated H-X9-DG protein